MVREGRKFVVPEHVLASVYGKTSKQLKMSEKRRDEVIAAAVFASFRNQEFGTRFKLPAGYREADYDEDASGIDVILANEAGRLKKLQIKGIHLQRSIERRRLHQTKGVAQVTNRRYQRIIKEDSAELGKQVKKELDKIVQDYSGIFLILHVYADFANQTSLEIAIQKCRKRIESLKAKEVWFLRPMPVRVIPGKSKKPNCHSYKLIQVTPNRHTYAYTFSI